MATPSLKVEGIGKRYRIGVQRHDTLRDHLASGARALARKNSHVRLDDRDFWAIRDVTFSVERGQVVGLIGRNGAGKSTMLKVLSRITRPTEGRVEIFGRVGSLLEVGTGFHPELTGRENIYLNGSILGMGRREINRKFDAIVDFAEIEKFLDTPVKRYSSGMYVRLAFAVAAHFEPEILLVDEVLAVGDAAFQRKCLGKMSEVAQEGRTVIFVSHNMAAVQALCTRGILFRNGQLMLEGTIGEAVTAYLGTIEEGASQSLTERTERLGRGQVRLVGVDATSSATETGGALMTGRPARFVFRVAPGQPGISCSFTVYDHHGTPVATFNSASLSSSDPSELAALESLSCELDELLLVPGRYRINAEIALNGEVQDHVEGAVIFDVEPGQVRGRAAPTSGKYGSVFIPHRWEPHRNAAA
jgi:lipopolysaccharide transport system ATP-binding protein